MLLCKPEYAYGTAGNPDKIPPSSSVLFEVGVPLKDPDHLATCIQSVWTILIPLSQTDRVIQLPLSAWSSVGTQFRFSLSSIVCDNYNSVLGRKEN